MAIAFGKLSYGGAGGLAGAHCRYILAQDKYAKKQGVEYAEHANLPDWAKDRPTAFWDAADIHERANGVRFREWQGALPVELSREAQKRIAQDFAQKVLGDRQVYTLAIHQKERPGHPANPHVHLMWSDRQVDGIEREREHYFKRYNSKKPERGGCQKDQSLNAGKGRHSERLLEIREMWQRGVNKELEKAKVKQHIDMRSYEAQGSNRLAQVHLGPGAHAMELRGERTALGDYNREVKRANQQLEQIGKLKAIEPEKVVRVYEMGLEVAERKTQTWQEKMEAFEKYGGVSQKRAKVEVLAKELETRLETEQTVLMGEAKNPIAEIEAKLEQAQKELAAAQVLLDKSKLDPKAVAEVKAEVRKEAKSIKVARDGTELLRPDFELAKVELEIKRLEQLQKLEQATHEQENLGKVLHQHRAKDDIEPRRKQGLELGRKRQPELEKDLNRERLDSDATRLREAQKLPPRDFLKQYAEGRERGAREPRSWEQVMRSSPQFVAMAGKLDQAKRHARDLDARIEFERKAHPMRAALGIGVFAKLGKELVQTHQAVERAKAKLDQFAKDPRVIGRFKAEAEHEAEGIMAARHETKLLKPVYEQALSLIKAEREQKRENGRAKGHERGRGRGR